MLTKLDKVIVRSFLARYALTLGAILGLFILVDAVDRLPQIANQKTVLGALSTALNYYCSHMPLFLVDFTPGINLVAGVWTLLGLLSRNELMALQTSGISFQRAVRYLVVAACAPSALLWLGQEALGPALLKLHYSSEIAVRERNPLSSIRDIISVDESGRLIRADSFNPKSGRLGGVWVFPSPTEPQRLNAKHGVFEPGGIRLFQVDAWDTSGQRQPKSHLNECFVRTNLSPEVLMRKRQIPTYLTGQVLLKLAVTLTGFPEHSLLKAEFHRRRADIVVSGGLLLLSIPLILTYAYRGSGTGLAWWMQRIIERAMPLSVYAVFYVIKVTAETLSPGVWAVWLPAIFLGVVGGACYMWNRL